MCVVSVILFYFILPIISFLVNLSIRNSNNTTSFNLIFKGGAQVCHQLHIVATNDEVWHSLCRYNSPSLPLSSPPPIDDYPISFFPRSKLPCHTWKQVYIQMVDYKAAMVCYFKTK